MKYLLLVIGFLFLIPACAVESNTESVVDTSNENNPAPSASVVDTSNANNPAPSPTREDQYQKNDDDDDEQRRAQSPQTLPDISYFATNKSDRFFVDFEDIIAGHPFVGARSPRPHNDAQVYFSSSDPRWRDAQDPSDFPAIYAVADGYINMSALWFYNVVDHSNSEPPWWHVAYGFTLRVATDNGNFIEFMY